MSEESNEALHKATWVTFQLLINLGLIGSVIDQYPEHVQEGWIERLNMIAAWAEKETEEAQSFGEAYDEEDEAE